MVFHVAQQPINKEAVRMLVQDVGYALASDKTGIPQPTLRQWAKRGGWNGRSIPHAQAVTSVTMAPADAQAAFIQQNEKRTRWSLSRAHRLHAAQAARGKLAPRETLQVAQGAAITHGWKTQEGEKTQVAVNIAILDSAPVT